MRPEDFRPDDLFGQIQSLVDALGEERRARESAEAANHAKAELLAMIGEELRPPLETIAGMCELLLSSSLDQTQAHYAETLYQSARSLLSVLGDVLDFSRLESGRLALGQDPFDLHELVENIGSVLQSRANAQGLTGSVDLSANCPRILIGDAARLRQVVMSLIENALKYTAIGSIRLHVSATEADGRPFLRFDLIDTGVGLSRAVQERLFQPSVEVDSKLGGKSSPTGLALPIASKLARLMGGELGCESVVGQGTHYWFNFPAERPRPLASSPRRGNDASQSGLSGHVLVIENNAVNRMLIGSYLAEFGLTNDVVDNGEAALLSLATRPYDLVLMDTSVAALDPVETTRRIRSLRAPASHVPIVALIPQSTKSHCGAYLAVGIDGCVLKPIKGHELHAALVPFLSGAREEPVLRLVKG